MPAPSLATGQRSLADRSVTYPLWPPLTAGCPETSDETVQYPLEVTYDYDAVPDDLFDRPPEPGLDRWRPLLPPLADGTGLGEGATPLVAVSDVADWAGFDGAVYVKDESQNPTWSQKDRLNRLTVSAAVETDAAGVAVSSSGNHGASAAAYAARAGLPTVVLTAPDTPSAVQRFLRAYDAAVLRVPDWDARREAVDRLAEAFDYHPVSSRTPVHTGHPFGPEGYKPIAYETVLQLGRETPGEERPVPGTVFVPTAHAELLYGVWKGFRELETLGVVEDTPAMVACEPGARAPLSAAMAPDGDDSAMSSDGDDAAAGFDGDEGLPSVDPAPTAAHSIKATQATHRGVRALDESGGFAAAPSDETIRAARDRLAAAGLWQEFSAAAGVAGLRAALADGRAVEGPVVCLATSSGFKDGDEWEAPRAEPSWDAIVPTLDAEYGMSRD